MRVMIAGGGTGGHVSPGVAVAEAIESEAGESRVFFMGRRGSIEERIVRSTGRDFVAVPAMGLRRAADVRNLAMPFAVAAGYAASLAALVLCRPAVAIGTGGFVSIPPLVAALTLRVPVLLAEQNAYPGLATRVLSRFAREVHVSFDESRRFLPRARKVVLSGNPVRASFGGADRAAARRELGLSADAPVVFVVGGSRGAHTLNVAVGGAAPGLRDLGVEIIAQTGRADRESVSRATSAAGTRAVVREFFDDVAKAYTASDLVVARAGATTIAEITVVGRPSILVPYPYAAEAHQMKNARAMEAAGASVVVPDEELTGASLAEQVREIVSDGVRLGRMADAARALARPDAAVRVARAALGLAGRGAPDAPGGTPS